jgi:outer membrane receptor protein involved in Fe transport
MPAEFAGGLVQMQTIDFPSTRTFTVAMKSGFNHATTFGRFLTYPGGGRDFFGFDDGTRAAPSVIPGDQRLIPGRFTPAQLQTLGRSFSNIWEPTGTGSQRPNLDWTASGGGTWGRLGLVGALSFGNRAQTQKELQRYIRQGLDSPFVFTNYPDFREYFETARLGGVLNAAVRLSPNHKVLFRNTLTRDAEKSAREFLGYDGGLDSNISAQRLRFVERTLLSTGVEGDHSLVKLRNSVFHWQFTYARSSRGEPDLREVFRSLLPDGRYSFSAIGSSAVRFFSDLSDRILEPQADFSVPFFRGKVSGLWKSGYRATIRNRDFQARRFRFIPQRITTLNLFAPSNQLLAPENIRPDGFQITEFTRGTDTYDAMLDIHAGYSMVDLALGGKLRIVTGLRVEDAFQRVNTIDNLVPGARPIVATLQNRDPIPSVNVIYSLTDKSNLRASYSRTLSRPDFRELSPFDFNNTLGGFVTQGNPDLKRASIHNFDGRWESFAGGNQVIAASFFFKDFTNPIEQTILPANDLRQTFVNAAGARNFGFELEFRRSLGSLTRRLSEFAVSSNFTFVDSNIRIAPRDASLLTSKSRPLLGQSRYIGNAVLEWARPRWHSNSRFYWNHVSRRISDVGTFGVPDIYQAGNNFIDFVYQYTFDEKAKWSLRMEAENLANNHYHWTQGEFLQRSYRLGRTLQVGLTYQIF